MGAGLDLDAGLLALLDDIPLSDDDAGWGLLVNGAKTALKASTNTLKRASGCPRLPWGGVIRCR